MQEEIIVQENSSNKRLDSFIAEKIENLSRTGIQKLIEDGKVLVNEKKAKASYKPVEGDKILVTIEQKPQLDLKAQKIPVPVIYEDNDIIVVNKPKGMVVHPANGNPDGTLVNALLGMFEESENESNDENLSDGDVADESINNENKIEDGSNNHSSYNIKDGTLSNIGGNVRPGIVHRLDKDTSGLLIVAKNDVAHIKMSKEIQDRLVTKKYIALVKGNIPENEATIDLPIARSTKDRKKMAVRPDGRSAVTHFSVLERLSDYTLIAAKLETGRTHQIRVHMAHIKHPVAGDNVYGPEKNSLGLEGQALHAARLTLRHPSSGETLTFRAAIPEWFTLALKKAGHDSNIDIDKLIDGAKFDG